MRELAATAGLKVRMPPSGRPLDTLAFRLARRRLLLPSGAFTPGSAAHEIGGAGMGGDPATSVTDPWGRLWDADNVVVADGAAFPAGCHQNVTLTIMAHALRAARQLTRELRAGRP
jgi:choline dehydrogenase-like flavoprotein